MAKSIPVSLLTGRWRIVSMSAWDDEYLDEEVEAYIEFDEDGCGSVQFGYIRGLMDHYRTKMRDGKRVVQFRWDGGDGADGTPMDGIGWAMLEGDTLTGTISVHHDDDSEFVAKKKAQRPKAKARKTKQ